MNRLPRIAPIATSVRRALRASGGRNAGTPLEIASTPVRAVQPAAKACRTSSTPTVAVAGGRGAVPAAGTGSRCPVARRARPTSSITAHEQTNR
jgi:hypothetical protein